MKKNSVPVITGRKILTTSKGINYDVWVDKNGRYATSDDLGHEVHVVDLTDLMNYIEENGWVDQLGYFRITDQDCEYAQEHWFRKEPKEITYCGKKIVDFVYDGYEDECNIVILVTEDGGCYEDYMSDEEFDRLVDTVAEERSKA